MGQPRWNTLSFYNVCAAGLVPLLITRREDLFRKPARGVICSRATFYFGTARGDWEAIAEPQIRSGSMCAVTSVLNLTLATGSP
jgi:hypothetical protein